MMEWQEIRKRPDQGNEFLEVLTGSEAIRMIKFCVLEKLFWWQHGRRIIRR